MVSLPLAEHSLAVVPRDPDLHTHPSSDFGEQCLHANGLANVGWWNTGSGLWFRFGRDCYSNILGRTANPRCQQALELLLRHRPGAPAFEVEHTTSIYSGILRMADLLALQPNMDIRLHIVAPGLRRDKVFHELRRPVFSLLDRGPLSESCSFLSYDSVRELAAQPHLSHLADSVLDEYEEDAEE